MKIILEKEKCIGCGSCVAVCSELFELEEDGKSHLKGSKSDPKKEELEIEDLGCVKEAADVCPVQAIEIEK